MKVPQLLVAVNERQRGRMRCLSPENNKRIANSEVEGYTGSSVQEYQEVGRESKERT